MFIMLLFLFPLVKEEYYAGKYDFYQLVVFLSAGIISAALCGKQLTSFSNIAQYIVIDSYQSITRLSGFYGDPNFYSAQITVALAGCLILIPKVARKQIVPLGISVFFLVYCGFLSGSKSFFLILITLIILWVIDIFHVRGKMSTKITLVLGSLLLCVFVATSSMFSEWIDIFLMRFSNTNSLSDLTTKRSDIWITYLKTLITSPKLFLLGQGITKINIGNRASHNTIIQIFYQFGLVGMPMLAAWIVSFYKDKPLPISTHTHVPSILLLVAGIFLPWLALDMLFFDEFFLFQLFAYIGIQYICVEQNTLSSEAQPAPDLPIK